MKANLEKNTLRNYLLGLIKDESVLHEIDDLLFRDKEFFDEISLIEDEIIEDYASGNLSHEEKLLVENNFFNSQSRKKRLNIVLSLQKIADEIIINKNQENKSFFENLKEYLNRFKWQLATVSILLIVGLSVFWWRSNESDKAFQELAQLYRDNRPTNSRFTGLNYAPLIITRGIEEKEKSNLLTNIELRLSNEATNSPSVESYHALGRFYLTQKRFDEAEKQLLEAIKLNPNSAQLHNDLGSVYFEKAESFDQTKRFNLLNQANEAFGKALNLDKKLLTALFNKALCLQQLKLNKEAKSAWQSYIEVDSNSDWTKEAEKNLKKLEAETSQNKTPQQVGDDYLQAVKTKNYDLAWKINTETKEMIMEVDVYGN
ncbi:MAG: tetratricopeptide repeat protein [Pyrinomonadaceae bacterium]|nr:tetratricopeptide repeat protein [Pyrinomonadaceae bacterium]